VSNFSEYVQEIASVAEHTIATDLQGNILGLEEAVSAGIGLLRAAGAANSKVLIVANGGSAAIASHVQNDLVKACGIRAMVFTEQPLLTAISNDDGYESAFELPTDIWSDAGDVMIAISSSGCSENILRAVNVAKRHGVKVVTLSGFDGDNNLRELGDVNLYSNSSEYGVIENVHSIITHSMTDSLKSEGR
jgi:D-sedoheptulose 7-phosphate isomerase